MPFLSKGGGKWLPIFQLELCKPQGCNRTSLVALGCTCALPLLDSLFSVLLLPQLNSLLQDLVTTSISFTDPTAQPHCSAASPPPLRLSPTWFRSRLFHMCLPETGISSQSSWRQKRDGTHPWDFTQPQLSRCQAPHVCPTYRHTVDVYLQLTCGPYL